MTTFGGSLLVPVVAGSLAPANGMLDTDTHRRFDGGCGTWGGRVDAVMDVRER